MEEIARRILRVRADQDFGEAKALIDPSRMKRLADQALRWRPPQYAGTVLLFRADRDIRGYSTPPDSLGWEQYCAQLQVLDLPCSHSEVLAEPQVLQIVAKIESSIHAGGAPPTPLPADAVNFIQ